MTTGPDFSAYLDAIYRRNAPAAVPLGELFIEPAIQERITGRPIDYADDGSVRAVL